jgi:hypothetical protein
VDSPSTWWSADAVLIPLERRANDSRERALPVNC